MTPEEFKNEMIRLRDEVYELRIDDHGMWMIDKEIRHFNMDMLMVKTLRDLGYGEGVDIFVKTDKWYA